MKMILSGMIFALITALFPTSAFAKQTVVCKQINDSRTIKKNGRTVTLNLVMNRDGSLSTSRTRVKTTGFARDKNDLVYTSMKVRSVNESQQGVEYDFTNFFLEPERADSMLDIQLQFDARVLTDGFNGQRATFVIGSEDANPETAFAFGFYLLCHQR